MARRKTSRDSARAGTRRKSAASPAAKSAAKSAAAPAAPAAAVRASAAKSIILFSDGTGNSSAKLFKTNVWRLYEAVDLGPPAGKLQRQIAYYDDGVGTSGFKPLAMLGGAFGLGLKRNVLEIYRYACRNYDPEATPPEGGDVEEKGDHIYGFGFSRGAFTMRLVIGLIADQGLIPYTDEAELESKALAAWRAFRRTSKRRAIHWIRTRFQSPAPTSVGEAAAQGQTAEEPAPDPGRTKDYDPSLNHRPVIRMIGVWDTVSAYGGPVAEITRAIDNWIYPLSMPNYALHPRIRSACHALALDDERDSFWPLLWDEIAEKAIEGTKVDDRPAPWLKGGRLQQIWFAGMHADVGGGYPDESLSYVSLLWMIGEGQRCGLRTADEVTGRYFALANSFGPLHDSRSGLGSYYRYQPRKIAAFLAAPADDDTVTSTLGLRDPQIGAGRAEKGLLAKVVVHESVVARIATGTDGYAPIGLPSAYEVVPPRPTVTETTALETTGGDQPAGTGTAARKTPLLPDHVRDWLSPAATEAVAAAMEGPWNAVLWRRLTYFLTVIATLALVSMPWWIGGAARREAGDLQLALDSRNLIGNLIRLPGELLPAFTQRWVDTWANYSIVFLAIVVAIVVLMKLSTRLQQRMRDRARAIWHSCIPRIPPATAATGPSQLRGRRVSGVESVRNSGGYQRLVQLLKWVLLPNLVFAPLLAGLMLLATLGVATQATLPWMERESLCPGVPAQALGSGIRFDFRTDAVCNPTGVDVVEGERYLITVEVVEDWQDGGYPTTPQGLTAGDMRWLAGYAGLPLRRVLDARYLQPLAAVRAADGGFFSRLLGSVPVRRLNLQPVEDNPNRYTVEFEAPATGKLSLFANDSVLLFAPGFFYANNAGSACVTIAPARLARGTVPGPVQGGNGPVCVGAATPKPRAAATRPPRPGRSPRR